jgi:hypothetical protein
MKRHLTVALLALAATAALAAPRARAAERILSYDTHITVQKDGLVVVRETIKVHAERRQIKRGIYRDIPTIYRHVPIVKVGPFLTRKTISLRLREVLRDGRPEPYHTEGRRNGKRIYVGRKDVYLDPGDYTYTLVYSLDRQLGFFEDHDEFFFNAIPTDWDFPIESASSTVVLPDSVPADAVELKAYTGRQGARGEDYAAQLDEGGNAVFTVTRPLGAHEGLSVAVRWPKGHVEEPTRTDKVAHFVRDNLGPLVGLLGLLFVFAYYTGAWVAVGRDPARGLIIPLFEPPDGFSPAAMRYLMEMGYDNKCLTAAVVNMAVKGYLTIEDVDGDYALVKQTDDKSALAPEEKKVANALLSRRSRITLEQKQHKRVKRAIDRLKEALALALHKRFFFRNRAYVVPAVVATGLVLLAAGFLSPSGQPAAFPFICLWLSIWTIGVVALVGAALSQWRGVFSRGVRGLGSLPGAVGLSLFALPFLFFELMGIGFLAAASSLWLIPLLVLAAVINLAFYHLMKAPTQGGRRIMDQIEGFRMYLGAAEKQRLDMLHAPRRTPELFEKYLPYALALDVENRWAEQFSDVLERAAAGGQYSPGWYVGTGFSARAPSGLGSSISSMGSSFSGAIASASVAPGSSSGFGGGGGGGAGGGGGGGGGGGW